MQRTNFDTFPQRIDFFVRAIFPSLLPGGGKSTGRVQFPPAELVAICALSSVKVALYRYFCRFPERRIAFDVLPTSIPENNPMKFAKKIKESNAHVSLRFPQSYKARNNRGVADEISQNYLVK